MLFCAFGAFWRKKSNTMKSTCLLFTSNPMYFFLLFLLFLGIFQEKIKKVSNFFNFFLLVREIYFIKCSTFLARFPSILKSREDYFCCTFPLLLLKSMNKQEKARKSMIKHDKVKCRFSWCSSRILMSHLLSSSIFLQPLIGLGLETLAQSLEDLCTDLQAILQSLPPS